MNSPKTKQVIAAHIPVLHRGYMQLFDKFPAAKELFVVSTDYLKKFDYLRKDLRALTPHQVVEILGTYKRFSSVKLLNKLAMSKLDKKQYEIILPDEDISRLIGDNFKYALVSYCPVFLRWDRSSVEAIDKHDPDEVLSLTEFDQRIMRKALDLANRSADIFRRVGAVIIDSKGEITNYAYNSAEPSQYSPWIEGDPRNLFNRGVGIEMSVFTHAEALLIAEAAKVGKSLTGSLLYVTTFPCPACSKLIAHSGIKKLFYKDGYAVLDGKRVLADYGVELARVLVDDNSEDQDSLVPYISKA